MTRRQALVTSVIALLGLMLNSGASAQSEKPAETPPQATSEGVTSAMGVALHGKIVKIDKAKKLVTVEGSEGRTVTLRVENPYNLAAVKVGDPVVAHFYEIVTIRKKKPGEAVPSASLKEGISTAKPGGIPGATATQQMRVVVTVVDIDKAKGTVTIKGPDGTVETVKARDRRNLAKIKAGDDLVVSVTRAIAISLDKAPMS